MSGGAQARWMALGDKVVPALDRNDDKFGESCVDQDQADRNRGANL
jgi:hypothetical protein